MKKFFALALIMFAAIAVNAQVPTTGYQTVWRGTNYANTGTNISPSVTIDVSRSQVVALQWGVAAAAANGTNAIAIAMSADGRNFLPYSLYVLNGVSAGTNVAGTNITVGGFNYLKFGFMTNWFSSGDMTNCWLLYSQKISSP